MFKVFFLAVSVFSFSETISFNTADTPPYSTDTSEGFYDILLHEIMNNLGYDLTINHYPSERSLTWVNEGHNAGEFARIRGLSETYLDLVIVDEPLSYFSFVALKLKDSPIIIDSWSDLTPYRVGYLNGWKIYEEYLGFGPKISIANSPDVLFNLLLANRVEVILYSNFRAQQYIASKDIQTIEIIEKPLSVRTMHLYLHKSYSFLVNGINEQLSMMKRNGRYDQLLEALLQ